MSKLFDDEMSISEHQLDQYVGAIVEDAARVTNPAVASQIIATKLAATGARLNTECQARLASKVAAQLAGRMFATSYDMALNDLGANQLVPIDSGDVLVAANGNTGTWIITVNTKFEWVDAVVTNEVASKFGLLVFTVAGFSSMSQGFSSQGVSATNPSLSLAGFTPDYERRRMNPLLGIEYDPNTAIQIQAHEIANAPNRFMMSLALRLTNVAVPGSRCRITHVRPCGTC